ncbi:hypothetical protein IVB41_00015 [Bradyrhizobium sp. 44]|uniref:hypothetical protein n=1 Tax=Bradyrhizobium sp. 44 TaxID=2782675 RepID=UPI001FF99889|nr:hypothetical protein [Bradyrhizobium sp. 44]MCK1282316.1 hypothetical protein [Bradyrhizobium sp. 44]
MTELEDDVSLTGRTTTPGEDHDPAENDLEDEPSLGTLDHHHSQEDGQQEVGAIWSRNHAERGIADQDGLLEQVGSQDWQHMVIA